MRKTTRPTAEKLRSILESAELICGVDSETARRVREKLAEVEKADRPRDELLSLLRQVVRLLERELVT